MTNIYLCYFGDGRYWDNTIRIPAYPSGYSSTRPFRYSDKRIQSELLSDIEKKEYRDMFSNFHTTICMRFISEDSKWKILPIRRVNILNIDYFPDNHSIYYMYGPFFKFESIDDVNQAIREIPHDERDSIKESLFFRSESIFATENFLEEGEKEDRSWINFINLISKSSLIHDNARHGLFFRFDTPRKKQPAHVGILHRSWREGYTYGAILDEGSSYELAYYHRVPFMIGSHDSAESVQIKYVVPSGNIELNRTEEDLTGNYQTHILNITALSPTGTSEELTISPNQASIKTSSGQVINCLKIPIPFKVKISYPYRVQKTYIWLFFLWISLSISIAFDKVSDVLEGKISLWVLIGSAIAALISSIAIFILQGKSSAK